MAKQVKFDAVKFEETIGRLAAVYKKSKKEISKQQASLILRDCIRFTPPHRGGSFKQSDSRRVSIGKKSIIRQVDRIFRDITSFGFANQMSDFSIRMMDYLRDGRYGSAQHMLLDKTGRVFHFARTPERAWHLRNINDWGRSRKSQGVVWIGEPGAMKSYYAKLFSRIMRGVGGWMNAAKLLGVEMPAQASKAAKWVGFSRTKESEWDFSVTCGNDVPYLNKRERVELIAQRSLSNRMKNSRLELKHASAAVAKKLQKAIDTGRIAGEKEIAAALRLNQNTAQT